MRQKIQIIFQDPFLPGSQNESKGHRRRATNGSPRFVLYRFGKDRHDLLGKWVCSRPDGELSSRISGGQRQSLESPELFH